MHGFSRWRCRNDRRFVNDYLWNTISIRDTAVKGRKENFYHGVLLGLLSHMENWAVWSNIESGGGYCDILLEVPENRVGVVIEMKYTQEDRNGGSLYRSSGTD